MIKRILSSAACVLLLVSLLLLSSCADNTSELIVPEDFSFSLTWNCYGDSFYDSATGELIKQKSASHIEDYTTTYFMTDDEKTEIYALIDRMDPWSYPAEYNPVIGESLPSRTIILNVTADGKSKTITCRNVSLTDDPNGARGSRFMKVHDAVVRIVTSSGAWQALPDPEILYD